MNGMQNLGAGFISARHSCFQPIDTGFTRGPPTGAPPTDDIRITEASDTRETVSGDIRILEP